MHDIRLNPQRPTNPSRPHLTHALPQQSQRLWHKAKCLISVRMMAHSRSLQVLQSIA